VTGFDRSRSLRLVLPDVSPVGVDPDVEVPVDGVEAGTRSDLRCFEIDVPALEHLVLVPEVQYLERLVDRYHPEHATAPQSRRGRQGSAEPLLERNRSRVLTIR